MEFETWERAKLIEEIKSEIKIHKYPDNYGKYLAGVRLIEKLDGKTDFELRGIYLEYKQYDTDFMQKYYEHVEQARFFNRPESDADFIFWAKRPLWTIDEAVALVLGKDPRRVTFNKVIPYAQKSPFAVLFLQTRDLAIRYVKFQELTSPTLPPLFLQWAEKMEIVIPRALISAILEMHERSIAVDQKYSPDTNDDKAKDSQIEEQEKPPESAEERRTRIFNRQEELKKQGYKDFQKRVAAEKKRATHKTDFIFRLKHFF